MQSKISKVVFTGGPHGGKTSVMEAIATEFPGTVFVPEAATLIMAGGFPVPGIHLDYSAQWQRNFQRAVTALQYAIENTCLMVAEKNGARLLVCDRGIMDGAAYDGGKEAFCSNFGINEMTALSRYDSVIHLETLASSKPELFGKCNNNTRYETVDRAVEIDLAIRHAWSAHPNRLIIEGIRSVEEQTEKALSHIRRLLDMQPHVDTQTTAVQGRI